MSSHLLLSLPLISPLSSVLPSPFLSGSCVLLILDTCTHINTGRLISLCFCFSNNKAPSLLTVFQSSLTLALLPEVSSIISAHRAISDTDTMNEMLSLSSPHLITLYYYKHSNHVPSSENNSLGCVFTVMFFLMFQGLKRNPSSKYQCCSTLRPAHF